MKSTWVIEMWRTSCHVNHQVRWLRPDIRLLLATVDEHMVVTVLVPSWSVLPSDTGRPSDQFSHDNLKSRRTIHIYEQLHRRSRFNFICNKYSSLREKLPMCTRQHCGTCGQMVSTQNQRSCNACSMMNSFDRQKTYAMSPSP